MRRGGAGWSSSRTKPWEPLGGGLRRLSKNTDSRVPTATVSDGFLPTAKTSEIVIKAVNDRPSISSPKVTLSGLANTPLAMTYESLRTAAGVTDVDSTQAIRIMSVDTGTLQRWTGTQSVAVNLGSSAPVAQKLLSAGQKLR